MGASFKLSINLSYKYNALINYLYTLYFLNHTVADLVVENKKESMHREIFECTPGE